MTATPLINKQPRTGLGFRPGSGIRLPELTSIRALAALAVCLSHAAFWTGHYTDDWIGRVAARLEVGVTLFFVLSGFLLFRPWVRALLDTSGAEPTGTGELPSLRRYAWHRAKRILPGYWITVIAIYLLDVWPLPGLEPDAPDNATGWEGFFRTMFFLQSAELGWFHAGTTHFWSMVVEVGFYLVLPFVGMLIWWLARGVWRPWLVLGLVVGFGVLSPLWAILSHQWDAMPYMARLWPVGYFDWFAAGMALAVLARMGAKVSVAFAWPLAAAFFLFSTTTLAGPATLVPDQLSEALWKNVLYLATAAAIMAPLVLRGKEPLPDVPIPGARWLRHPALNWVGEISYEFFLIHLIVMEHVIPMLDYNTFQGSTFGVFVVTTAITIPLAWLLRRFTDVITRNPAPPSPWGKRL